MAKFVWNAGVFFFEPLFPGDTSTEVAVRNSDDDTLASLWSDRAGTSILSNPFNITTPGKIQFFTDAGEYDIYADRGGEQAIWENEIIGPPSGVIPGDEKTADHTLVPEDKSRLYEYDGTDLVITIPTEAADDLGGGFSVGGVNLNATNLLFDDTGITLLYPAGMTPVIAQNCPFTLIKLRSAANTWLLYGALTPA